MANDLQNMSNQVPSGVNTISQQTSRMNGYNNTLGSLDDTLSKFYSLVNPYKDILQQYLDSDGEDSGLFGFAMNNYMDEGTNR
jgi:conjugal transfer/entry exclusion protein